jgi:hypothetical protein
MKLYCINRDAVTAKFTASIARISIAYINNAVPPPIHSNVLEIRSGDHSPVQQSDSVMYHKP